MTSPLSEWECEM